MSEGRNTYCVRICRIYGNYGILCFVNYDDIILMKLRAVAGHRNSLPLLFLWPRLKEALTNNYDDGEGKELKTGGKELWWKWSEWVEGQHEVNNAKVGPPPLQESFHFYNIFMSILIRTHFYTHTSSSTCPYSYILRVDIFFICKLEGRWMHLKRYQISQNLAK